MPRQSSKVVKTYWQAKLDEQQRSGLSVQAFCKKQDISAANMYYWSRKFSEQSSFVQVTRSTTTTAINTQKIQPQKTIKIKLKSGHRISIPADVESKLIIALLQGLCQ